MKDGRETENIVYNPDSNSNTFTYRLTVENTVQDSYPAVITDTQTVTDILPEGITVSGSLPAGVSQETVDVDGVDRQKLTWTVDNIGYDDAAKSVDITVSIDKTVFKNKEVDLGNETTVLDIKLSQYKEDDPIGGGDSTGDKMNLFIRTAGETEGNDGYIYAGTIDVGQKVNKAVFASSEFNTDGEVNDALDNATDRERMLNDFVTANDNGTMARYTADGLPSKSDINKTLSTLYTDRHGRPAVTLSDTQVILWYKVTKNDDEELTRYFKITDEGETKFQGGVNLPSCSYHLDGIVVDVSDLGTVIPTGAQVNVTNTAELVGITGNKLSDSATVSIYYKEQKSSYGTNLLSAIIENDDINTESVDEIATKADELDKANSVVASEEKADETNAVEKEENTASDNNSSQETTTDSTDKEESKPVDEEKPTTPTYPTEEESTEQDNITSSDDKDKNESAVKSVEQQTLESQEE